LVVVAALSLKSEHHRTVYSALSPPTPLSIVLHISTLIFFGQRSAGRRDRPGCLRCAPAGRGRAAVWPITRRRTGRVLKTSASVISTCQIVNNKYAGRRAAGTELDEHLAGVDSDAEDATINAARLIVRHYHAVPAVTMTRCRNHCPSSPCSVLLGGVSTDLCRAPDKAS